MNKIYRGIVMKKKTYAITLDEDKVKPFKAWLKKRGLTFSGYLNSVIDEQVEAIEMVSSVDGRNVTSSDLLKMAGKMAMKLSKELKK
jgi:hypothetical protein